MFNENGKTIFDDVKAHKIIHSTIPEDKVFEDAKAFKIIKDTNLNFNEIHNNKHSPSFNFRLDNDLLSFFGYPDISISNNPEYMNKYPKLTKQEYSIANWQTEEGTPNELNRFMRQEQSGQSIDDIRSQDNAYENGLAAIEKMINEDTIKFNKNLDEHKKTIDDPLLTPVQKQTKIDDIKKEEEKLSRKESIRHKYKTTNPVIRPAFTKAQSTIGNLIKGKIQRKAPAAAQPAVAVQPKAIDSGGAVESKPTTQPVPVPVPAPATSTLKPISRPASPVKGTPIDPDDESGYNSDTTTVNNDTITVSDVHKPFYQKAIKTLNSKELVNLPNKTKLNVTNPKQFQKLNDLYFQIHGVNKQYVTLGKLREKLLVNIADNSKTPTK